MNASGYPFSFNLNAAPTSSNPFTFDTGINPLSATTGKLELLNGDDSSTSVVKTSEAYTGTISLRSAFNATAPANHLPVELVIKVLTSNAWSQWWELVSLTHVCQHWRNVALGTPQLWADATQAALKERSKTFSQTWMQPMFLFLPTLLTRAAPWPLRIDLLRAKCLTSLVQQGPVLSSHFSRISHLYVEVHDASDVAEVLGVIRTHIPNVEILHMPQVKRGWGTAPISIHHLSSWEDSDLPHLHTLTIPGRCFTRAIAVASLKTLVLFDGPPSHGLFLTALDRCSPTLESLTLHRWTHPTRESRAVDSTARTVQLPNLHQLKVALHSEHSNIRPPTLLFAGLSLPPSVAIEIDNPGNTCQLLPKHLIGLHAPPFFDAMCLYLFKAPQTVSLHGYVGGVEHLRVQKRLLFYSTRHESQTLSEFLDEHRHPTVTQLAVDIDTDVQVEYAPHGREGPLHMFVSSFPNLHRLDLLGTNVGHAKLRMTRAFLNLPHLGNPPAAQGMGKTLAYVCSVSKDVESVGFIDDLRAQLDELEALLAAHRAEGGRRLNKLELCMAYSSRTPHPPPRVYPDIRSAAPSSVLTAYLSPIYLPRFRTLVDEVEFIGDVKTRGPGYRIVKRAAPHLSWSTRSSRGEKRTTVGSRRKGW